MTGEECCISILLWLQLCVLDDLAALLISTELKMDHKKQ